MLWLKNIIMLAALCGSLLWAAEEKKAPPELSVPKLKQAPPKIDGLLDDEAWKDAARSDAFRGANGEASTLNCFYRIMQDDKALYIAVEVPGDSKKITASTSEHDSDSVWSDDDVELFINPTGGKDFPYYQIILNSKGATFDVEMKDSTDKDFAWEPKYEAKVNVAADKWTVELAIPWSSFDRTEKSAAEWSFNLAHVKSAGEELFWSPVHAGNSHQPEMFGRLKDMPVRALKK